MARADREAYEFMCICMYIDRYIYIYMCVCVCFSPMLEEMGLCSAFLYPFSVETSCVTVAVQSVPMDLKVQGAATMQLKDLFQIHREDSPISDSCCSYYS